MRNNIIVVGMQFSDEGKGRVIDFLGKNYDVVVRYHGGANAGHCIHYNEKKIMVRTIPSGIGNDNTICMVAGGVIIDPKVFKEEIQEFIKNNINIENRIFVSPDCHLVFPWHKYHSGARENIRDKKIGSTKLGIGPCHEDKYAQIGIRTSHILSLSETEFKELMYKAVKERNILFESLYNIEKIDVDEIYNNQKEYFDFLKQYIDPNFRFRLRDYLQTKKVMFEGAHGTFISIDRGTYPYVTSSQCLSGDVFVNGEVNYKSIDKVIGVIKPYITRVGNGPLPTEFNFESDFSKHIFSDGTEIESVTKRNQRIGALDLVLAKESVLLNGIQEIFLTKLDLMTGLTKIPVCFEYFYKNTKIKSVPLLGDWYNIKPIITYIDGWQEDISGIKEFEKLPIQAQNYINMIQEYLGTKINRISVGKNRNCVIEV